MPHWRLNLSDHVTGSDTSANVLQYTWLFLVSNRRIYQKITAELDEAFPDPTSPLDFNTLAELPYLNAVINEGLRLGTPLSGLPRVVPPEGFFVEGSFIPGGTVTSVPNFTQQLDPRNFSPNPEAFIPERWLDGFKDPNGRADENAIMSFSFGSLVVHCDTRCSSS